MALDNAKALFGSLGFKRPVEGNTTDDIAALEKQMGITFPQVYRDFLLWMGKNRAGILLGSEWLSPDLPGLKGKLLKAIATYNPKLKLPDDAFVIWGSQGYEFAFLRLKMGDASLVYRFHGTLDKDATDFPIANVNLEQWVIQKMQEHVTKLKTQGQQW